MPSPLPHPDHRLGVLNALASAVAFGVMSFLVHAGRLRVPPSELAFIRALVSVVVLAPVALLRIAPAFARGSGFLWLRSAAGATSILCYFWNLQHASVGTAKALADLSPMFVAILGFLFLRERLRMAEAGAIGLTVLGALALQWPSATTPSARVVLVGTAGALTAGVAYLALKQATQRFSAPVVVFCLSGVTLFTSSLLPSPAWVMPEGSELAVALGVGVSGLIGQVLMTRSYLHLRPAVASTLGLSALLWGVLLDVIFHAHLPTAPEWAAYALILVGVALLEGFSRRGK